jgi:hypothetical protein
MAAAGVGWVASKVRMITADDSKQTRERAKKHLAFMNRFLLLVGIASRRSRRPDGRPATL